MLQLTPVTVASSRGCCGRASAPQHVHASSKHPSMPTSPSSGFWALTVDQPALGSGQRRACKHCKPSQPYPASPPFSTANCNSSTSIAGTSRDYNTVVAPTRAAQDTAASASAAHAHAQPGAMAKPVSISQLAMGAAATSSTDTDDCLVMAVAMGYKLEIHQRFVRSLRDTGFRGEAQPQ